jgi:hypothetical protein
LYCRATWTRRSGSATPPSGRNSSAFTKLKTAVLAPMPSDSVEIATSAKAGFFTSIRNPNRRSCTISSSRRCRWSQSASQKALELRRSSSHL